MATIQKTSVLGKNVSVTIDYDDVAKKITGIHYENSGDRVLRIESMGDKKWIYVAPKDDKQDISLTAIVQPSYSIDFLHRMTYGD